MKDHFDVFIITRRRCLLKKRILILSTVGLIVLGTAFAVGASKNHSGWCGSHDGGQGKIDRIAQKLDLNGTQKDKLQAVQESFLQVRQAMTQARGQTFDQVLDLISSETLDQDQVQSIVKRHQSIVEEFTPKVTTKIADFHAILSPEQKSRAAEFLQKWKERFEDRRQSHS